MCMQMKETVRLLDNGCWRNDSKVISPEAMDRAVDVVRRFKQVWALGLRCLWLWGAQACRLRFALRCSWLLLSSALSAGGGDPRGLDQGSRYISHAGGREPRGAAQQDPGEITC